ncbi:MAG: LuxR C-terminal-related transcriptional regulator [Treponema sp.]|jgi:LuxR family maltose regulon positive regulatory protein|nr:LuxR C-terminal-related transcriptional regulator [Treponema sp.]
MMIKTPFFHSTSPVISEHLRYLERPRIDRLLEKAVQSPFITVVASAGYGKTQAVSSFLQKSKVMTIWLQLSEWDNLGWRFWENFTRSISLYNPGIAARFMELGFPNTERQFDRYLDLASEAIKPNMKYVFVFDDFHCIREKPILRVLEWSSRIPYTRISIIIISRTEPALNTISFLSKGLLVPITEDELRFTQDEMIAYFQLLGLKLPAALIPSLYEDTEGWAFAVSFAGLSLEKEHTGVGHIRSSMWINIFRLIEAEFFTTLPQEVQKYLIKLSLIDHWPSELLRELAIPESTDERVMDEMKKLSSFIRYDAYLHTYRMHHLFREYLNEKQGELSREEKQAVYDKTAQWCLRNNLKMDAAAYYEKAEDYQGIITVMYSFPLALPKGVARYFLEMVERILETLDETGEAPIILRYIVHVRLLVNLRRFEEAIEESQRTIQKFKNLPSSPLSCRVLAMNYNNLGIIMTLICIFTKDYDFVRYFEQANQYYSKNPFVPPGPMTSVTVGSYVCRVSYPASPGEFDRAIEAMASSIPYTANSMNGCFYGIDDLSRSELAYFQGDIKRAEQCARQAIYKARKKEQYEIETRGLFFLLRINLHTGVVQEEIFRQLDAQLEITAYQNRYTLYDLVSGWFYTQIGQPGRLATWLRDDFEESDVHSMIYELENLVKIKCHIAEKRYHQALTSLKNEKKWPGGVEFLFGKLEKLVLEAVCRYHLKEKKEKAFRVLEAAYLMATSNGLEMPFIELGQDMYTLAGAALQAGTSVIPPAWLERIQKNASAYWKKLLVVVEKDRKQQGERQGLSHREQTVLIGLSRGLKREEIAGDNAISINTVKATITSIYNKLGAVNRADAIRIAGATGILSQEE